MTVVKNPGLVACFDTMLSILTISCLCFIYYSPQVINESYKGIGKKPEVSQMILQNGHLVELPMET